MGRSPIIEADIGEIIAANARRADCAPQSIQAMAIRETEVSFVCVGTPSQANGNLDLRYIRRICEQIGQALKDKVGTSHSRHTQHHLAGHDAHDRDPHPGRMLRKKGWQSTSAFATILSFCAKVRR